MNFGEKVLMLRKARNLSQRQIAERLGITTRSYQEYELKNVKPRKRQTVDKLCEIYGVTAGQLLGDEDLFYIDVEEQHGLRGARQAKKILEEAQAYLSGGDISSDEREAFIESLMRMYLRSKEISREKFGKKDK